MSLVTLPTRVCEDGSALVVLIGPPNVAVAWQLSGPGTLTPLLGSFTDPQGRAYARYTPTSGSVGSAVTIGAEYGADVPPTPAVLVSVTPADALWGEPVTITWSSSGVYGDLNASGRWEKQGDPYQYGNALTYSHEYPPATPHPWSGTVSASGQLANVYLQCVEYLWPVPDDVLMTLTLSGNGFYGQVIGQAALAVKAPPPPFSLHATVMNAAWTRVVGHQFHQKVLFGGGTFSPDPIATNNDASSDPANWAGAECPVTDWAGLRFTSAHQALADHLASGISLLGMRPSTGSLTISLAADGGAFTHDWSAMGDPATPLTLTPDANGRVDLFLYPRAHTLLGAPYADATPGSDLMFTFTYDGGA